MFINTNPTYKTYNRRDLFFLCVCVTTVHKDPGQTWKGGSPKQAGAQYLLPRPALIIAFTAFVNT